MKLDKLSVVMQVSESLAKRMMADRQTIRCSMLLLRFSGHDPLSPEETRTGWRTVTHEDHTHMYAVGWRFQKEQEEAQAKREAEMAVCPYVECECGHHEDRWG